MNFTTKTSNTVTTTLQVVKPNLTITKSVDKATAFAGDTLVYTLTYANTGNGAASNVVLTDGAPANTTYQANTGSGVVSSGNVTWTLPTVAAGATGSVTMTVKINSNVAVCDGSHRANDDDNDDRDHRYGRYGHHAGDGCAHDGSCVSSIANSASIKATSVTSLTSNTVTTTLAPAPKANLTITKSVNKTTAMAGDSLVYTLTYANTGNAAASSVVVADAVPANTTYQASTGGGSISASTVSWTIPTLAAGAQASVTMTVKVNSNITVCSDSSHRSGDNDSADSDHRYHRNGHYDGDHCEHDGSCVSSITNTATIKANTISSKTSNVVTTTLSRPADYRMNGGGSFGIATHGFELHCSAQQGPNNLEVNWGNGNKFKLDQVLTAACSTDSSISQAMPSAPFNTYKGTGAGKVNGTTAASVEWTFTDGGEPGTRDRATIVIKGRTGNVIMTTTGYISNGNQQALK